MTSHFEDIIATFVAPQAMHFYAESRVIDYVSADGTTTEDITAIIGDEVVETVETDEGDIKVRRREVWVHRDPTSTWKGIADPDLRGSVTYAGESWQIRDVLVGDATFVHFTIEIVRGHELTRPNYRR